MEKEKIENMSNHILDFIDKVNTIFSKLDETYTIDGRISEEERKLMDSYATKILEVYNRTGYIPEPLKNRMDKIIAKGISKGLR